MDQFWSALGAISTALGSIIVLMGGIYARSQVNEARLARNVTLLTGFQRWYENYELWEFREKLIGGKFGKDQFDPELLPQRDRYYFWTIFDQLDFLGMLLDRKLIDFDLVVSSFHSPPLVWNAVKPYVMQRREMGYPLLGIYFERLVQRYAVTNRMPIEHETN